jgi:hypothetical protein
MGMLWKWVYLVGGVVAALIGAFNFQAPPVVSWLLVLMGFGIRYLLFAAVATALGAVPAVGPFLSGFFGGFLGFLGPVALATLFMWFWKKYFSSMM